jgi:agmatine deiminase
MKNMRHKHLRIISLASTLAILILIGFIAFYVNENSNFQAAGDFEPVETIYLNWNDEDSVVLSTIAAKISKYENVTFFIDENGLEESKIKKQIEEKQGITANVTFRKVPNRPQNVWIRDYSPVFMKNHRKMKMIKFQYWDPKVDISAYISNQDNIPLKSTGIYSLGGTREFNGKGTSIFVASHERIANPLFRYNKKEFENELKKELNLKKIIWLDRGIPQDELPSYGLLDYNIFPTGSNNHLDEFCRFIAPDKIMLTYLTADEIQNNPILTEAKRRMDINFQILRKSTDQDGNLFEIIPVPFAPVIIRPFYSTPDTSDFRTEVTSYMNFLITNHTVLLPSYRDTDSTRATQLKEEYLAKTFKKFFPDKEIIFINTGLLNSRGGGIHCLTASKPAVKKKTKKSFTLRFKKKSKA